MLYFVSKQPKKSIDGKMRNPSPSTLKSRDFSIWLLLLILLYLCIFQIYESSGCNNTLRLNESFSRSEQLKRNRQTVIQKWRNQLFSVFRWRNNKTAMLRLFVTNWIDHNTELKLFHHCKKAMKNGSPQKTNTKLRAAVRWLLCRSIHSSFRNCNLSDMVWNISLENIFFFIQPSIPTIQILLG